MNILDSPQRSLKNLSENQEEELHGFCIGQANNAIYTTDTSDIVKFKETVKYDCCDNGFGKLVHFVTIIESFIKT